MLNVLRTFASQYATSATIRALIDSMNDAIDPRADLAKFYEAWWDINTAYGEGLNNWGRIVGVSRYLRIPNLGDVFGFHNDSIPEDWQPFNFGVFYTGREATQTYILDDASYRVLILTKALANITATTARGMNTLLRNLFPGRGKVYVIDNGGMSMTFYFLFSLTVTEQAILTESGVLPHPAGVAYNIVVIPVESGLIGFKQQAGSQTFNHGTFYVRH
jgi:hypothetical protein